MQWSGLLFTMCTLAWVGSTTHLTPKALISRSCVLSRDAVQSVRWCEHDPLIIWASVQRCISAAVTAAQAAAGSQLRVVGLGITNQRETTVVWSRSTGQPLHNAIVWLDNRTR